MVTAPDIPDTPAQPGPIQASARQLESVAAGITGHGGDVNAAMNTAALSFSDLIAGDIKALAGFNEAAWQSAFQGLVWGAATTHRWATNVETFKAERAKLVAQWQEAQGSGFGVPEPHLRGGQEQRQQSIETYEARVDEAGGKLSASIAAAAQKLLDQLDGEADSRAAELGREPTDADLRALGSAGLLSWGGYLAYQGRDVAAPPLTPAQAKHLAYQIEVAAALGDHETVRKGLAIIDDLNNSILDGHGPPQGIEALQAFVGALGLSGLTFLQKYRRRAGLTGPNILGTSLLIVSDERLRDGDGSTGGFDRLPDDIKRLLTTEIIEDFDEAALNRWKDLAYLLGDTPYEGGRQFSAALTLRIGEIVHHFDEKLPDIIGRGYYQDGLDDAFQTLLGVSTRNVDANLDVLDTVVPRNAPDVLRTLFSHEWPDNGKAVGGLIDWIPEYTEKYLDKNLSTAERAIALEKANRGAELLLESIYHQWQQEHAVEDNTEFSDFFNGVKNNPWLARGLGDIAEVNIHVLAQAPGSGGKDGADVVDGALQIGADGRRAFLQLIATDRTAIEELGVTAGRYENGLLQLAAKGDDVYNQGYVGRVVNNLNSQLNFALHDAGARGAAIDQESARRLDSAISIGSRAVGTALSYIPGVGPVLNSIVVTSGDLLKTGEPSPLDQVNAEDSDPNKQYDAGQNEALLAIQWLDAGNGPSIRAEYPDLFDEHGRVRADITQEQYSRLSSALYNSEEWRQYKIGLTDPEPPPPAPK